MISSDTITLSSDALAVQDDNPETLSSALLAAWN